MFINMHLDACLLIPFKFTTFGLLKRLGFIVLLEKYLYTGKADYLYIRKPMLEIERLSQIPKLIIKCLIYR